LTSEWEELRGSDKRRAREGQKQVAIRRWSSCLDRDTEAGVERPEMDDEDLGCPDQVTFELEDLPIGGTIDV
jgi:hypothetical protein